MALAIDSSTPAIVGTGSGTSVTTASFTPPDSTLLVACIARFATSTVTMSNSGTALTWTLKADNSNSRVYTAPLTTSQSMTVTFSQVSSTALGMKVYAVTGADLTTPIGATGTGTSTSDPSTVTGYSSTIANSLGIASVAYLDSPGSFTSSDTITSYSDGATFAALGINKAATTATPSTSVTFNMDNSTPLFPDYEWAAVEVLPLVTPLATVPKVFSNAAHRASIW